MGYRATWEDRPRRRHVARYRWKAFDKCATSVAGQRCAAHRRTRRNPRVGAMEGGDERARVKRALSVRAPTSRTGSHGENCDPMALTRPPKRVGQTDDAEPATRLSSPVFCAAPSPAHHDAPLIAERAATRGRGAMEGDAHADVKPALSVRAPASRTGSTGGNVDSLTATRPTERVSQSPSLRRRRDQAWCRSLRISSGFAQPIRTKR
jgi:hypothetical protein